MKKFLLLSSALGSLMMSSMTYAQSVETYDIKNALNPYLMNRNTYTGTIESNGLQAGYQGGLYDFTGGKGTLNDGADLSRDNSYFFLTGIDNTSITLHLSSPSTIHTLDFFSPTPATVGNLYGAGNLSGATISFGGQSATLSSQPWGTPCYLISCNDRFSLLGTSLDGIVTDTVTISNFSVSRPDLDRLYYFSEITLNGAANGGLPAIPNIPAVPEPQTYAMLLSGLGLAGFMARRRKQVARGA